MRQRFGALRAATAGAADSFSTERRAGTWVSILFRILNFVTSLGLFGGVCDYSLIPALIVKIFRLSALTDCLKELASAGIIFKIAVGYVMVWPLD